MVYFILYIKVCLSALDLSCLLKSDVFMGIYLHSFPGIDFLYLFFPQESWQFCILTVLFPHLTTVFLPDKGVGGSTGFPGNYYDSATDVMTLQLILFSRKLKLSSILHGILMSVLLPQTPVG